MTARISPAAGKDRTAQRPISQELRDLFAEVRNWGKWGPDDQLGTLNYITPQKVRDAARLVRTGRVVSIAHDILAVTPRQAAAEVPPRSTVPHLGWTRPAVLEVFKPTAPVYAVLEELTIRCHGYSATHLDALTHGAYDGHYWNGRAVDAAVTDAGVQWASIYAMREGVVTRGVLLDVAKARGVDHFQVDDTVTVEDLDAAEALSKTKVISGDAVIVRSGNPAPRYIRPGIDSPEDLATRVGLAPECARWFQLREVAMLGTDGPEVLPPAYVDPLRFPLHQIVLAQMGLPLLDNVATDPLVAACAEEGRNEFMFTVAPLRIPQASGSNVNPLALF